MKKKNLTKRLIIASVVWILLLLAATGAYLWLDSDIETLRDQTSKAKSKLIDSDIEYEKTAKNIQNEEIAHKLFLDFEQSEDSDKSLFRRNILIRKLGEITNELGSIKVSFKMSPFSAYSPIPKTKNVEVMASHVTMEYAALNDVEVFKLMSKIREKISGTVYFKKLEMEKVGEIDSKVLLDISNTDIPHLVRGVIEFDWIAIKLKEDEQAAYSYSSTQDGGA